jgi:RNA polymerase sigma factor (sigma-70 family)
MARTKKKSKKKVLAKRKKTSSKKSVIKKPIVEEIDEAQIANEKYIKYINCIRRSKSTDEANLAFENLYKMLSPKIQKLISRFNIPGYDHSDILQEALFALRYKAVKDYDKARGINDEPALFDKFALLCIRRHLATEFKSSYQNKKRVLNQAVSMDKENNKNNNNPDSEVTLSAIIVDPHDKNVLKKVADEEFYKNLNTLLAKQLSDFEMEVFMLYKQKYSYEEIAEKINNRRKKIFVNIKGVDNALSRIKHKAQIILQNYELKNKADYE